MCQRLCMCRIKGLQRKEQSLMCVFSNCQPFNKLTTPTTVRSFYFRRLGLCQWLLKATYSQSQSNVLIQVPNYHVPCEMETNFSSTHEEARSLLHERFWKRMKNVYLGAE
jgi:hypothetical protein